MLKFVAPVVLGMHTSVVITFCSKKVLFYLKLGNGIYCKTSYPMSFPPQGDHGEAGRTTSSSSA
jgi:hypothetical protein